MGKASIKICVEKDPSPLVKIFAHKFTLARNQSDFIKVFRKIHGCFSLCSTENPQSLSITIDHDTISLCSGIKAKTQIIIHTDFADDIDKRTGKTKKIKIDHLWRHPLLAFRISRLLDFKKPNWIDAGKRFWHDNQSYPGMPEGIKLICTDENKELVLGRDSDAIISGKALDLAEIMSGDAILVESAIAGKVTCNLSFENTVVISDLCLQTLLGNR